MPLLNYTSKVPASRTVAQVQAKLVEHGARQAIMEWDDKGRVVALSFSVKTPNGDIPIRLPIDAVAILRVLQRQADNREIPRQYANEDHAYRVAWRIIKDWVEAQLSLLQTEMVQLQEIFLPYIITNDGGTLFEHMEEKHFLLGLGEET